MPTVPPLYLHIHSSGLPYAFSEGDYIMVGTEGERYIISAETAAQVSIRPSHAVGEGDHVGEPAALEYDHSRIGAARARTW